MNVRKAVELLTSGLAGFAVAWSLPALGPFVGVSGDMAKMGIGALVFAGSTSLAATIEAALEKLEKEAVRYSSFVGSGALVALGLGLAMLGVPLAGALMGFGVFLVFLKAYLAHKELAEELKALERSAKSLLVTGALAAAYFVAPGPLRGPLGLAVYPALAWSFLSARS